MSSSTFLIIDGYPKDKREEFDRFGMRQAWKLYADLLTRRSPNTKPNAIYDILFPSDPDSSLPNGAELKNYDAIIWTGCSLTVYKEDPRVKRQLSIVQQAFELGIPSFGSCWAAQIAAAVAGGEVKAHPLGREMGIARKITLTTEGKKHPLYQGKPEVFDAFVSHDDEITRIPPHSKVLAGNSYSKVQAIEIHYKKGWFWAVQYHPEYNLHEISRLFLAREKLLLNQNFFSNTDEIKKHVEELETLFQNPSRKDLRWRFAIDDSLLSDDVREIEFMNWLKQLSS